MDSRKKQISTKLYASFNRMELIAKSTNAEKRVCDILNRYGIRYIKQYPIYTGRKTYYADIYIPSTKVVLEIDGAYHFTKEQTRKDSNRSAGIRRLGYHVHRIKNTDANNVYKILSKINALRR